MAKIFDRLSNAIAGIRKYSPAVATALQGITTGVSTLESQLQKMQAQRPANQTDLQNASSTVKGLKTHVQTLVSALREGNGKPAATGTTSVASAVPSTGSGGGS